MSLLDEALRWRQGGVAVVPVYYRDKRPMVRWQQWQRRLPSEDKLRSWFRPGVQRNAAVICGWAGLTVLDFDDVRSYLSWRNWARQNSSAATAVASTTYQVITRRGIHVYLFVDEVPRCHKLRYTDADGVIENWGEIKGRGGYVIAAGSVHPSGHLYRAHDKNAPIVRVPSLVEVVPEPPAKTELAPTYPTELRVFPTSSLMPKSRIEEIKERVDLLGFFPEARSSGRGWYMARCPFHEDQNPSFWINTEKGICGCYAGCTDRPLDVIGLYARLHSLNNREAIKELTRRIGG